jgi:hypothetical protein
MGLIEHPYPTVLSVKNNPDQTKGLPFPSEESKSTSEIQWSARDPLATLSFPWEMGKIPAYADRCQRHV